CIFLLNHSKTACPTADHSEEDAFIFLRDVSPGHAGPQLTGGLVFGQLNVVCASLLLNVFSVSASLPAVCCKVCFSSMTVSASSISDGSGLCWQMTRFRRAQGSSVHLPLFDSSAEICTHVKTCVNHLQPRCILLLNRPKVVRPTADHSEEDALIFTGNVSPGHAGPQLTGGFVLGQLNVVCASSLVNVFSVSTSLLAVCCKVCFSSMTVSASSLSDGGGVRWQMTSINSFQTRHIFLLNHSKTARPTADHSEEDALIFTGNISPGHAGPQLTGGLVRQLNVAR
ncbi:hypothetical protein TYRP_023673, partial [Tyrophagus putrescentiae]